MFSETQYEPSGVHNADTSSSTVAAPAPEASEPEPAQPVDAAPVASAEQHASEPHAETLELVRRRQRSPMAPPASASPAEETATPADKAADDEAGIPSAEELSKLMDQYGAPQQAPTEGEIVEGRVVAISDKGVVVDIGGKFEGFIPAQEFLEPEQPFPFQSGQNIEVQLTGEHKDGYAVLSYKRAHRRRIWSTLEKAYHDKTNVTGRIVDRVKGGLVVDIGIRAFLPSSQADLRPVHDLEEWKNRDLEVRVIKLNRKRGNVVVSRRAFLEDEQETQRHKLMESLAEGQILHGTVKSITSYGVFVDLGGIDGLLHVSDLSWGRMTNPADVVSPGQELEVQVLKFDREKNRISLGRRQLLARPVGHGSRTLPARRARSRSRSGRGGLRRVCRTRTWRRGFGPCFGDELVQAQTASF